jgi:hydrogenase maturation protease
VTRTLVAGVGNVFFGDDGFGCEVARRLASARLPTDAAVVDFGIRGVHLAFALSSGYDRAVIVDAVARGGRPGTLYVIEPDRDGSVTALTDAHGIDVESVLAMAQRLGAAPGRVVIVGCEAGDLEEGMGLSAAVASAVEPAIALIQSLLRDGVRAVGGADP